MRRSAIRVLSIALLLPLSGWFVVSSMTPPTQDPKPAPAPEGQGDPRDGGRPGPRGEGRRGGRGPGGGPNLHGAMEQMQRELDAVTESIADPAKNDATLTSLGRMLAGAGASQGGEPKNMAEIPAAEQAGHKLAFRRALVVLARDIAEVELLVIDGKNAEAAAMFEKKIVPQRDAGHEKFGGDDDHDGPHAPKPGGEPK